MFWIFSSLAGLVYFALSVGQYSVWFALLKIALMVALIVIALMGCALMLRRFK